MKLVTVGSVALDTILTAHGKAERALGGSATHASIAASYHVKRQGIVGVVGKDFPAKHLTLLKNRGVDLAGLETAKGKTFHWKGRYHRDMNRRDTLRTDLGVFATFAPEMPAAYRKAPFVFLANIDPDLQHKVLDQAHPKAFSLLDTMDLWIKIKKRSLLRVLKKVKAAIFNDEEIRQLTGEHSLIKAARNTLKMGPQWVVLKRGEHGATLIGKTTIFHVPAYPTDQVKDPTGAGDSFAGGFIGHLAKMGRISPSALRGAMASGTVMASFNVEGFSVDRTRKLNASMIRRRLAELKSMSRY